ncbi:MAG: MoxR family ATPase [Polyangiales bacterium]
MKPTETTEKTTPDPGALDERLRQVGYFASSDLALSLRLAMALDRPLLVEGPAGVGKTELARASALALGCPLIRLQCYEGLDESRALYEWDYAKQILYTQLLRDAVRDEVSTPGEGVGPSKIDAALTRAASIESAFFSERFLVSRPLLQAIRAPSKVVLLIDEVDRADPEFEALLLEVLADHAITIPELGTFRAIEKPLVILTTNATRELTEALRRRCLHASLDYPEPSRELAIVMSRVPQVSEALATRLVEFVVKLRELELRKAPSIAETIEWARAFLVLGASALDQEVARSTLGVLLKHGEDREKVAAKLTSVIAERRST